MKKYTIIYSEWISTTHYLTQYAHVETDNLAETLKNYDVWFVFDGFCKITHD